jgi:hypothetical protein
MDSYLIRRLGALVMYLSFRVDRAEAQPSEFSGSLHNSMSLGIEAVVHDMAFGSYFVPCR